VEVTVTQKTLAQASARQARLVHGHRPPVTKLQYGEKSVIERDDKLQRLVQERMKHLEKETEEIGMFTLTKICHVHHQLILNFKRQPSSRNIQIFPRSHQRPLRSSTTSCELFSIPRNQKAFVDICFIHSSHLCSPQQTQTHPQLTPSSPQALKRYNIHDDWRQYALYIVHGDQERCLGLKEKPLLLFKQLDKEGRKPMFMLRRHASPQDGWSGAAGGGGNGALDSASVSGSTLGSGSGSGKTVPGGVL